jgi:MinD superfamily P-loop ATPase
MTLTKPKELVVISGKGGTGKTSITAALAQCFSSKVLADCDVDAADLHLVMKVKSYKMFPFQSGHIAQINAEKCLNCGLCASLCRFHAIAPFGDAYAVNDLSCEGCKVCVDACPEHAIEWTESKCGVWKESVTSQGLMYHARLYPGTENSGKLVSHVREKARQSALANNIPLILVDGPPGIGCPVIASITGASAVLVVTEPTPSGHHDLERVLLLARHFRVPAFILINKADLSESFCQRIQESSTRFDAKVIGQIRYSPLFTEAQVLGQSILEAFPESEESKTIQAVAIDLAINLELKGSL